jgi:nicotinate phosphoribosyltransferase
VHRVAKRSIGKETRGGRKWVTRVLGDDGRAVEDRVSTVEGPHGDGVRGLAVPLMTGGAAVDPGWDLEGARRHHTAARDELPAVGLDLAPGPPAISTKVVDA